MNPFPLELEITVAVAALLGALVVGWLYERHRVSIHKQIAGAATSTVLNAVNNAHENIMDAVSDMHDDVHAAHEAVLNAHQDVLDGHDLVATAMSTEQARTIFAPLTPPAPAVEPVADAAPKTAKK